MDKTLQGKFPVADACQAASATGILCLFLVFVQLISHTILNVVVDDEVELFFCKAVVLRQKLIDFVDDGLGKFRDK